MDGAASGLVGLHAHEQQQQIHTDRHIYRNKTPANMQKSCTLTSLATPSHHIVHVTLTTPNVASMANSSLQNGMHICAAGLATAAIEQ